ncbi:phage holin family protein [Sphingomonas sp.]|uniref:phage holin family protein n=1 Tax=Sphingomonas sp. TaxID=28214 RepID=UPI0025E52AEB|nr:phage holin family protein [Sphingomonas sp.]
MGASHEASLRELLARLIEAGRAFAQAEIALVRKTVAAWAGAAKIGAALIIVALILANAAVIVLVAALGMALARWIGPAGGLAVAALIALIVAGLLGWLAAKRFSEMLK